MKIKKAVVTGGAGFIGSHLVQELLNQGYSVVILDDLSTGKMVNIEDLLKNADIEFIRGSITNLPLLQRIFRGTDCIFHQAALAKVPRSIDDPLKTNDVNITGTLNVLVAARDNRVKKVVYASSSSTYGDTPTFPKQEDMIPRPQSPYAVTKLAGEYYCNVFQQLYGLETACLRYFNVYGPKQDPDSEYAAVIPVFIKQVMNNRAPVIFGDGKQTRDFTFIQDAVQANILAAGSNATGVFNIGTGKRIMISELASSIIGISGKDLAPAYQKARPGDIKHSLADISRARSFGFQPKYTLEKGLQETFQWFAHVK